MIRIREGLERLSADLVELRDSLMWREIDPTPYIRQLHKSVEALEAKSDKVSVPRSPLDADAVWARWKALDFDLAKLDAREIRTLCVSPKTAMNLLLTSALRKNPDPLTRWMNFNGFVQAYFGQWRKMDEPQATEKLIEIMLSENRVHGRSKILEVWRRSLFLFSADAALRLGKIILKSRESVKQSCANFSIELSSPMASAAHEYAATAAADELAQHDTQRGRERALEDLLWMSDRLLTPTLNPDSYRSVMGKLIISRMAEVASFQSSLLSLVHADERLGDPRLASCAPNWRKVPEARERILAWLARETLQFFFDTLVPRDDANRRRAEFWLEYATKQGKIKDFQVAVSDVDLPKIHASRTKTIPSYSSIIGGKTSAFLMRFEGYGAEYVVIEFSETGNAAYIYTRNTFESRGLSLRSRSFHLIDDLKRIPAAHARIWHRLNTIEPWEAKARRQLADLGIRP